mgnify:FL=1
MLVTSLWSLVASIWLLDQKHILEWGIMVHKNNYHGGTRNSTEKDKGMESILRIYWTRICTD